jgi:hypothetical protein
MIVIHVGLKKCGSASIQQFLSANEGPLRRMGLDYTRIGRQFRPSHANLAAELKGGDNFDSSLGSLDGLARHWRSSPYALKVISTEMFEGLDASEIATLKRRLDGVGEDFRIVMVIRHLASLLPSLYVQRIKRGQKYYDFDRFFELQMGKKHIDYFDMARPWGEIFGWENLRVRALDAGTLVNCDLIDDFLATLDIDPADPQLQSLIRPGLFNVTEDWRVLEALRALHSGKTDLAPDHPLRLFLARADRRFDQACVERVAIEAGKRRDWTGDRGHYLTPAQARRCLDVYSGSIEALNQRLAERLPDPTDLNGTEPPTRDFLPHADVIPSAELEEFYDEMGHCFARRSGAEKTAELRWREAGLLDGRAGEAVAGAGESLRRPIISGKRLVLHIGLAKSGSASIQNFLWANEAVLRALSIDYAQVGRQPRFGDTAWAPLGKAHHNLVHEIVFRQKFEPNVGTFSELAESVRSSEHEISVVSSEMFERCDPQHVEKIHAILAPIGRRVQIVLIIRDLISLLPSSYTQKVRYGNKTHNFDDFYDDRIDEARADYFTVAKRWADVFGWENLSIRVLDRQYLANGDLIDDFLLTAGVEIDDLRVRATRRLGVVNEMSGWKIIEATRALYLRNHGLDDEHDLAVFAAKPQSLFDKKELERAAIEVGARFGWLGDKGLYLTGTQAQRALDTFATAITQLNERLRDPLPAPLGLEARGFVERPFLPSGEHIPAADLRSFYDQVAETRREVIARRVALSKRKGQARNKVLARRNARQAGEHPRSAIDGA